MESATEVAGTSQSTAAGTSQGSSAGTSQSTAAGKQSDRLARLRELQLRRNEARKLNHKETAEEDARNKRPANWDAKRKRVEWEEEEDTRRQECEASGENYDRVKMLELGAEEAERMERKQKSKRNPDGGFANFEEATFRQYTRLSKQVKPDKKEYAREKAKLGEAFYPTADTLGVMDHKDSDEAVDRMVNDLERQIAKREKYSRRRAYDPDADIDYINERNMKFNQKLERFYGKYTTEIKQNLERGTAV